MNSKNVSGHNEKLIGYSEHLFADRQSLVTSLQAECVKALETAIEERGEATLMVSGGSTPEPLYKSLSQFDLDWKSVYVALVDERWVEFEHDKSNEAFIVKHLMQNRAAAANLVGMKNSAESAAEGLLDCEAAYQQLAQPFDMTILGMGSDGHTASLFPHAPALNSALETNNICAVINAIKSDVTGDITQRMTLSLSGLLKSKQLVLLITGHEKLEVLRKAQAGTDISEMPIRALLQQSQVPLFVYWAP